MKQTIYLTCMIVLLVLAGVSHANKQQNSSKLNREVERLMEGALYLSAIELGGQEASTKLIEGIKKSIARIQALETSGLTKKMSLTEQWHLEFHTRNMLLEAWLAAREATAVKAALAQGNAVEMRARELYSAQLAKLEVPSEAGITYLFIDYKKRGFEGAVARVEEVRRLIKTGRPFAELAQEMTDDPAVRDKGASVSFHILESQADPELGKAIFKKMKTSEIDGPFLIPQGMVFVQLNEIKPAKPTPFEETRERFRNEALNEVRARARREALVEIDQLIEKKQNQKTGK